MRNFLRHVLFLILCIGTLTSTAWGQYVKVGDLAPDFVGRDIDGEDTFLSQFKEQVIVLVFWDNRVIKEFRWREQSYKLLHSLASIENQIIQRRGESKLKIIASYDHGAFNLFRRETRKIKNDLDLHFTQNRNLMISSKYYNSKRAFPATFIIDKSGKISSAIFGYSEDKMDQINSELMKLLGPDRRRIK